VLLVAGDSEQEPPVGWSQVVGLQHRLQTHGHVWGRYIGQGVAQRTSQISKITQKYQTYGTGCEPVNEGLSWSFNTE